MPEYSDPPSTDFQPYAGPERRTARRRDAADGIIAFARFRDVPGASGRFVGHDPGRWYEVRSWNEEADDPVSPPDYVWLDMGIVRGVPRDDLEIRRDLRRGRSSSRRSRVDRRPQSEIKRRPQSDFHTAEDATTAQLQRRSWVLLAMLAALALLVVPLVQWLPLGPSPQHAILAWLLVGLALYWFYAGMGYWPLLIVQALIFSVAAALLTIKVVLVIADVERLPVLRHTARLLLLVGAGFAAANLLGMLWALLRRPKS